MAAKRRWPQRFEHEARGMAEVVRGLGRRIGVETLERHHSHRAVLAAYVAINALISVGIMSAVAWVSHEPFIFPSLGPTAYLLFASPTSDAASPRNTVVGNLIGVLVGWASLWIFGLGDAPAAFETSITLDRVGATAVALGMTSGLMILVGTVHPPAASTTLTVALSIMHTPKQLGVVMLAVVLLTAQGFLINRAGGFDFPIWAPRRSTPEAGEPPGEQSGTTETV